MHQQYRLLHLLAQGRFRSGEELGAQLGMGRSGVWKLIKSLQEMGVDVQAVSGRGYRLAEPIGMLDRAAILTALSPAARGLLGGLDILPSVDSTNRSLMQRAPQGLPSGYVCLAEHQSEGRGRRGRDWVSPFGANIYLSLLWRFDLPGDQIGAVSVAAAVAVAEGLGAIGIDGIGLKWPNDVLYQGRKLAGILLEMSGEPGGPCQVVVGVGVNVNMPEAAGGGIDQPWTDLSRLTGRALDRNSVAGAILDALLRAMAAFAAEGLQPFRAAWNRLDVVTGRPIRLMLGERTVRGEALGLDPSGALVVDVDGERRRFHSGEVSLRAGP